MNMDDYIKEIIKGASSDNDRIYRVLRARGFALYKECDDIWVNSECNSLDIEDINAALKKHSIGTVTFDGKLMVKDPTGYMILAKWIFSKVNKGADDDPARWQIYKWEDLFLYSPSYGKISTMQLDPFIARYINSLISCGIDTAASCEGNINGNTIWVEFADYSYYEWYNWIIKHFVPTADECCLYAQWITKRAELNFTQSDKLDKYLGLNKYAEKLYNNRHKLLSIRNCICQKLYNALKNTP